MAGAGLRAAVRGLAVALGLATAFFGALARFLGLAAAFVFGRVAALVSFVGAALPRAFVFGVPPSELCFPAQCIRQLHFRESNKACPSGASTNFRFGSTSDSRSLPLPRLLSGVKRTFQTRPQRVR